MTESKPYDERKGREAIARALMEDGPQTSAESGGAAAPAAAAPLGDPVKLFCQNWNTVKQVLQFLKPHLPFFLRGVVDAIIKAGDVLKGVICH